MKHELSACILIPTEKCMHSVCVTSQLLVAVLFIAVLLVLKILATNAQWKACCFYLQRQDNSMAIIWWFDYIKCNLLITLCSSLVITNSK